MQYQTLPANFSYKETMKLGGHGQPIATLRDFGHSDCFLQLRMRTWSAGPHSFLVNIQNVSKGHALH